MAIAHSRKNCIPFEEQAVDDTWLTDDDGVTGPYIVYYIYVHISIQDYSVSVKGGGKIVHFGALSKCLNVIALSYFNPHLVSK